MKKCFVIGIIFLFLTVGFSPITIANDNTSPSNACPVPETGMEVYKDSNCNVSGCADCVFGHYYLISFGTSSFTQFQNFYPSSDYKKSYDVLDFLSGRLHFTSVGEHGLVEGYFSGRIIMKGFVGYFYRGLDKHMRPIRGFYGFASSVIAIGSPLN